MDHKTPLKTMIILIQKISIAKVMLECAAVDNDADKFHGSTGNISVTFVDIF